MRPFIIYALPRSRTAWLARFLTYRDWTCHHEAALAMRSIDDLIALARRPNTGAAETAASLAWRILHHHVPDLRAVVVRRPADAVVEAMLRVDVAGVATYDRDKLRAGMARGARALDEISAQPGVLAVDYADLDREDACAAIFQHCLPYGFDRVWWGQWRSCNVQADVRSVLRYYHSNRAAVDGFKRTCWREMRRLAYAGLIERRA